MQLKKGDLVKCKIHGTPIEGRIQWDYGKLFICQNEKSGGFCKDRMGYMYSWSIGSGSEEDLISNFITDLIIENPTDIEGIYVGAIVVNEDGKREVLAHCDRLWAVSYRDDFNRNYDWYTIEKLKKLGYTLTEKTLEEKVKDICPIIDNKFIEKIIQTVRDHDGGKK